jgi:hypothetical protein
MSNANNAGRLAALTRTMATRNPPARLDAGRDRVVQDLQLIEHNMIQHERG